MFSKALLAVAALGVCCECAGVSSSFWRPLWDARALGYRVEVPLAPGAGVAARAAYARRHGPRGAGLLARLGDGRGPSGYVHEHDSTDYGGDVRLYYTYPGANNNKVDT